MLRLNCASISGVSPFRSLPDSALARAALYQVSANGLFAKLDEREVAPAEPNVPVVLVQAREAQLAVIVMVGPLVRIAPQTFAAA